MLWGLNADLMMRGNTIEEIAHKVKETTFWERDRAINVGNYYSFFPARKALPTSPANFLTASCQIYDIVLGTFYGSFDGPSSVSNGDSSLSPSRV